MSFSHTIILELRKQLSARNYKKQTKAAHAAFYLTGIFIMPGFSVIYQRRSHLRIDAEVYITHSFISMKTIIGTKKLVCRENLVKIQGCAATVICYFSH
jgi:hypothetical protein